MKINKILRALSRQALRLQSEMNPDALYIADAYDYITDCKYQAWMPCFSQIEAEEGAFIAMGNDPILAESMTAEAVYTVDELLAKITC